MNRKALGDILNLKKRNLLSALFLWEKQNIFIAQKDFFKNTPIQQNQIGRGIMFKIG